VFVILTGLYLDELRKSSHGVTYCTQDRNKTAVKICRAFLFGFEDQLIFGKVFSNADDDHYFISMPLSSIQGQGLTGISDMKAPLRLMAIYMLQCNLCCERTIPQWLGSEGGW